MSEICVSYFMYTVTSLLPDSILFGHVISPYLIHLVYLIQQKSGYIRRPNNDSGTQGGDGRKRQPACPAAPRGRGAVDLRVICIDIKARRLVLGQSILESRHLRIFWPYL